MLWLMAVGLLGLVVGSFLNVVIIRLPKILQNQWEEDCRQCLNLPQESPKPLYNLLFPASHCPSCKNKLSIFENIPILSFIVLRAKCRHCHQAISWRYPTIEFFTAILSVWVVSHFGFHWNTIGPLFLTWCLIVLTVIDYDHQILPDSLTILLLWVGLAFNMLFKEHLLFDVVLGAMLGYLSLWSVYWVFKIFTGKEGLGYGDFKLFAALGAWLGWQFLPFILLMASLVGAIVGIFGILFMGKHRTTPIPFGPFLAVAGWLNLMWGDNIILYYLSLTHLT